MIVLQDVKKTFDNRTVLHIPYYQFEDGLSYLIKGESGTGKTTLFNIISGLTLPTEGIVDINNNFVHLMTEKQRDVFRSEHIGYVFQDFNLFDGMDALENVMVPLYFVSRKVGGREAKNRAMQALTSVGLKAHCHTKINRLSGGEKQRVAIARAIVNMPKVLLADEPTGNLDRANSGRICEMLVQCAAQCGATLLVISHDLSLAPKFTHTVDIADINAAEVEQ